jgi:hypothetical protein
MTANASRPTPLERPSIDELKSFGFKNNKKIKTNFDILGLRRLFKDYDQIIKPSHDKTKDDYPMQVATLDLATCELKELIKMAEYGYKIMEWQKTHKEFLKSCAKFSKEDTCKE